jgi:pimeloyl-ACP methyl ester carboxylesterase
MRERTVNALGPHGFHRIAYTEWGEADNSRVVICVHGLTRNGRDFDFLAEELARRYRVLCPDVAGRGRSDWLAVKADYTYPLYAADMAAVIARSGAQTVDWVGTSMGGIIGMMLAAQPGTPISRLVLNDVGSLIPKAALDHIARYVGLAPAFEGVAGVERYLREVNAGWGPLTDLQWAHLANYSQRVSADGKVHLVYDPAIGDAFRGELSDIDLSVAWNAVRCPVMLIRGAESEMLLAENVEAMRAARPDMRFVEVPECGHAPSLMDPTQIAAVRDFLA